MKLSRKRTDTGFTPPAGVLARDMTDAQKAENLGRAMLEAREKAEEEEERADLVRQVKLISAARKQRDPKHRHSGMVTVVTEGADGEEPIVTEVALTEPSEEIKALMDDVPPIFTGLMWDSLNEADRLEVLRRNGVDQKLIHASSVLEVLPAATLDYVLAWQRLINTGEAWQTSDTVFKMASGLQSTGLCMLGKTALTGPAHLCDFPGRDDVPIGLRGTAPYVKAVMGEAYLVWLQQQEE